MAIFNMVGGGSSSLNFKILGSAVQPSEAENLIWVNTTAITSWVVSPNQPQSPSEGTVWIVDGDSNGINILRKNAVEVFPSGCRQYIGGQWQAMAAYLFMGGQWVQFSDVYDGELFFDGNQYPAITGGWAADINTTGYSASIGKTMELSVVSNNGRIGMFAAANKLDFAGKSGVEITYMTTGSDMTLELRTREAGASQSGTPTFKVAMPMSAAENTVTLPLATDKTMGLYIYANGGTVGSTLTISKVRWF